MKIKFKEDYGDYKKGTVIEVVDFVKEAQSYLTYHYEMIYNGDSVEEVPDSTLTSLAEMFLSPDSVIKTDVSPKGKKLLIEVELTKNTVLLASCLCRSLYGEGSQQEIEGTFKVVAIYSQNLEEIKADILDKIAQLLKS